MTKRFAPIVAIVTLLIGCEPVEPAVATHDAAPPPDTTLIAEINARVRAQADSIMREYPAGVLASLPDSTFRRVWSAAKDHGSTNEGTSQWRMEGARVDSINARERLIASIERQASCDSPSRARIREHLDKGWFTDVLALIACRQVRIGVSAEIATASWGRPTRVNRTTTAYGVYEQWVYGDYGERGMLYFEDGILTTIQN